jgi:ribulose bisphosphate carboxylase small subunit
MAEKEEKKGEETPVEEQKIADISKETIITQIKQHLEGKTITVERIDEGFKEPEEWEDDIEIEDKTLKEALEEIDKFVGDEKTVKIVIAKEGNQEYIDIVVGDNKRRWIYLK